MIARPSHTGRLVLALGLALGIVAGARTAQAQTVEPTVITLKRSASVHHDVIVLGDIATVEGPSPTTVKRLQQLDLSELDATGGSETISSRHVHARLLLAGINLRSIRLAGAEETTVTLSSRAVAVPETRSADYQADVLAQAAEALAKAWLASPDDVHVEILSSQTGMVAKEGSAALPELELPTRLEPGRIQARLRWTHKGKIERLEQITLDARLRQTVILAAHNINRGEPLTPQNVVEDRRLLSTRVQQVKAEELLGSVARRGLVQGDVVNPKDVAAPRTVVAQVRARDGVRVVARKGQLTVVLQMAEALQAGQVGDLIRVRNLQSGQIVSAKVVSPQEVEVRLD
jgi:flagellar basal body P-ring formation protein FlgA